MKVRMTNAQFNKVKGLVKNWCANYDNRMCLPMDTKCPQMQCDTGLCSYFLKSVLPLDEKLLMEIAKPRDAITKRCKGCNSIFHTTSKNKLYCDECAEKQAKFSKKLYMRNYRRKRA